MGISLQVVTKFWIVYLLIDFYYKQYYYFYETTTLIMCSSAEPTYFQDFSSLFDGVCYVFDFDDKKYVYESNKLEKYLGYTPSEVEKMEDNRAKHFIHPSDQNEISSIVNQLINGFINEFKLDYRLRHKDGTYRWFQKKERVIQYNEKGKAKRVLGVISSVDNIKKKEEQVKKSEIRLKQITESLGDAFLILNKDLKIQFLSKGCSKFIANGITIKNALNTNIENSLPVIAGEGFIAMCKRSIEQNKKNKIEIKLNFLEEKKWFEVLIYPYKKGLCILVKDISSEKRVQKELEQKEAKYKAVIETQTELLCRFSPDFEIIFKNNAFTNFFSENKYDSFTEVFIEDLQKRVRQLIKRTGLKKELTKSIFQHKVENKKAWIEWTFYPIFDHKNQLIEFQAGGVDVTEQKKVQRQKEKALKSLKEKKDELLSSLNELRKVHNLVYEREQQLFAIIKQASEAIFILEPSGEVILKNQVADELFGLENKSLNNFKSIVAREEEDKIQKALLQGKQKNKCKQVLAEEIKFTSSLEKNFVGELSLSHIANNGKLQVVAIVRDITERKNNELKLVRAKRDLERALKERDRFISVVSHEIRTPLNAISGMSHLLMDSDPKEDQIEIIDILSFSAKNLLTLINDILDFSKIQAGKLRLEKISFDLKKTAEQSFKLYESKIKDKAINSEVNIDPNIPNRLLGDQVRLSQIIMNIVNNAVKFTSKGHIKFNVELLEKTESDVRVRIQLLDTGIGIPKNKIKQIFKPFEQANKSTYRKYGGTGLGLSIIKNLVELQEGKVEIKSEENKGTEVDIYLPFKIDKSSNSIKIRQSVRLRLAPLQLLYVEDVVPNQFFVKSLAKKWSLPLDIAENGEEAINKVYDKKYDLILMDIQLPGKDGFETTKAIRNGKSENKKTPIIAVTAEVLDFDLDKCFEVGLSDYISKPIDPEKLYQLFLEYGKSLIPVSESKKLKSSQSVKLSSKLEPLFDDDIEGYKKFLEIGWQTMVEYRQQVVQAIIESNDRKASDIRHKATGSLSYFGETEILSFLERLKGLPLLSQKQKNTLIQQANYLFNILEKQIENSIGELQKKEHDLDNKTLAPHQIKI